MKSLNSFVNEEKNTTSAGCIEMIQTIINQLSIEHPDCKWDSNEEKYTGKDKEVWFAAGQFLFDYMKELNQNDLVKIVKHFGWEEYVDMKKLSAADISFCIARVLQK